MKKWYLYGAGINCVGVIKFFGKENIVAIIDSDEKKHGEKLEGLSIISPIQYMQENHGEIIIITGYFESDAIADFLEEKGITNYYKSPYMQMGFYENCKDMVDKLQLAQKTEIVFAKQNPISELVAEELAESDVSVKYLERIDRLQEDSLIIVTNEAEKDFLMKTREISQNYVLDINEIYHKNFSFKNSKMKQFKDIHKGKRCFVIGNGPSLTYDDLNTLKEHNEICFGANRIYLSYENTNWRPDYYVAVDYTIVNNDSSKIMELEGTRFIRHFYKLAEDWNSEDIYEFKGLVCEPGKPQLSWDVEEGICIGNTVVYDAIQLALYMGFEEIYLLGVDMTSGIRYEDQGSHFYKTPNPNENLGRGNTPEARRALGYAAMEIEKKGRILRNATRGGELEEVKRVDFDSLF